MEDPSRPSIYATLMKIAWVTSERGTCSRRKVGCVIADDRGVILSSGYNGALSGFPHCQPHEDYLPCEISCHAEQNAIYWAARRGVSLNGAQMVCTDSPCIACAKGIIQAGLVRLFFDRPYRDNRGLELLYAANIEVKRVLV